MASVASLTLKYGVAPRYASGIWFTLFAINHSLFVIILFILALEFQQFFGPPAHSFLAILYCWNITGRLPFSRLAGSSPPTKEKKKTASQKKRYLTFEVW